MARIQQSIEVGVPVHAVYQQLTQFEDYPRFMQDVEIVRQLNDTHLHWWTRMENLRVEWDAEITEQQPDRCIAWRSTSGPANAGRVDLQPVGAEKARVTLTLESEPQQATGQLAGNSENALTHRLEQDLARLKQFIEDREAASGHAGHSVEDAFDPPRAADATYAAYVAESEAGGNEQAKPLQQDEAKDSSKLQQSIERAVPPSP